MGESRASLEVLRAQLPGTSSKNLLNEFKRLAREKSKDPASAPLGGDLGLIAEGTMDEKFETAVFSQKSMQVSSPQQSDFGWHLILVTSISEEPIDGICRRLIEGAQKALPITPPALFKFSSEKQSREALHPAALQFLGEGWGPPMKWNDNLAYMRHERLSEAGMVQISIHSERPLAVYSPHLNACRRSSRDTFQVDCTANTYALVSHVEYEGRGAAGRRLINVERGPSKRVFEPLQNGFLAVFGKQACKSSHL
jgi:hypothetical protein